MKKLYLFLLTLMVCLMSSAQTYYVVGKGDGLDWKPENPMEVTGPSFTLTNVEKFKISTVKATVSDDWTTFNAAAFAPIGDITQSGDCLNIEVGTDRDINLPWVGDWTITLSDGTSGTMTFTTTTPRPSTSDRFIKHPWGGGFSWIWQQMTAAGSGVFTYEGAWGGVGANINTSAYDAGTYWIPADDISGSSSLSIGEIATFTYNANDNTLSVTGTGSYVDLWLPGDWPEHSWEAPGPDNVNKFTRSGDVYTLTLTIPSESKYEFKVAGSNNWEPQWGFVGDEATGFSEETPTVALIGGANAWGNFKAGDYDVSFDITKKELTITPKSAPCESITLDKTELTLNLGNIGQLTATLTPSTTTDELSWSSDNTDVATVDENGKVTAVAAGTATITATCGAKTATCAVTVKAAEVPCVSITLDKTTLELNPGGNGQLTATVDPETTTDELSWSSDNTDVATVDQTGKVTGVAVGTATITATCGSQSATCAVTVKAAEVPCVSITLDKTSLELNPGGNGQLTATVDPETTTDALSWTTSNEAVAIVDQTGKVTAIAVGTATITATCGAKTATCEVAVKNVYALTGAFNGWGDSSPNPVFEDKGGNIYSLKLTSELIPQFKVKINDNWDTTLGAPDGAKLTLGTALSISGTGSDIEFADALIEKVQNAEVTLDLNANTLTVTGTPVYSHPDLWLPGNWPDHSWEDPGEGNVNKFSCTGDVYSLTLAVPEGDYQFKVAGAEWKPEFGFADGESTGFSDDNNSIVLSGSQNAWGHLKGTYSVTFNVATKALTFTPQATPCEGITLSKTELNLVAGSSDNLTATLTPDYTTDNVVWTSDNTDVATVDENGKVTAVAAGTATITATCGAKTATCAVTVEPQKVPCVAVTLDKTSLELIPGGNDKLTATVDPETTTDALSWTSSNEAVATVDQTGKVTAVAVGTATITATCGAKTATCEVAVKNVYALTGEFNNWGKDTPNPVFEDKGGNIYSVKLTSELIPQFKVKINDDWNTTLGAPDGAKLTLGTAISLASPGSDIEFADALIEKVQNAEVTLDLNANTLTVTGTPVYSHPDLWLPGNWPDHSWEDPGEGNVNKFSCTGDVYSLTLAVPEGDYQFKVAGAEWKPEFGFADGESTGFSDDNNSIVLSGSQNAWGHLKGTYSVTFNVATKALTFTPQATPCEGITLSKTELNLVVTGTETLTATLTPDYTTDNVVWTSDNTDVATVDENGKVTAVAAGTATITATCGAKTATCAVTVEPQKVPCVAVTLDKTSLELTPGANGQLTATVDPETTTDALSWSSSNADVATVDQTGKVTAIAVGTATITATCGAKTATCEVAVKNVYALTGKFNEWGDSSPNPVFEDKGGNIYSVKLTSDLIPQFKVKINDDWNTTLGAPDGAKLTLGTALNVSDTGSNIEFADALIEKVQNAEVTLDLNANTLTVTGTPVYAHPDLWLPGNWPDHSWEDPGEGNVNKFSCTGDVYSLTLAVPEGDYQFKVAGAEWKPEFGFADGESTGFSDDNNSIVLSGSQNAWGHLKGTYSVTFNVATKALTFTPQATPCEGITLSKTELNLVVTDTETLTATVTPDYTTDNVVWTSDNTDVATVDENGKVTAVAAGTATITATCGAKTATCAVTVEPQKVPCVSVTLDKTSLELIPGGNDKLTATVDPETTTDNLSWSTSNEAVATVDQTGKVTAVAVGTATITATCGTQSATCSVSVKNVYVLSGAFNGWGADSPNPVFEDKGNDTYYLKLDGDFVSGFKVKINDDWNTTLGATDGAKLTLGTAISLASPGSDIAFADALIEKVTDAEVTLDLASNTLTVTGTPVYNYPELWLPGNWPDHSWETPGPDNVNKFTREENLYTLSLSVPEGDYQFKVSGPNWAPQWGFTGSEADGFSNSNPTIALNGSQDAWGHLKGNYTVTFNISSKELTFTPQAAPCEGITLSKTELNLVVDGTDQLTATLSPEYTTETVVWSSDNEEVATVDQNGKVTAVAVGTATITATCGTQSATCAVTVKAQEVPCETLTLDKTALVLNPGGEGQLTATVTPTGTTDVVTWTTSNEEVATVDQTGKVTAVSLGMCTITATCGTQTATCEVTVESVYALSGSFNSWGAAFPDPVFENKGEGIYYLKLDGDLTTGFKVNINSWASEYGAPEGTKLQLDVPFTVVSSGGWNIEFADLLLQKVQNAEVTLDLNASTLTVTGTPVYDYPELWLPGNWPDHSWETPGEDNVNKFSRNGNVYTLKLSVPEGDYEFKVSGENWGPEWGFTGNEPEGFSDSNPTIALNGSFNAWGHLGGDYTVTFDINTYELSFLSDVVPCEGITLDETSVTIAVGTVYQLAATVTPISTTDPVVWSSDNEAVASVDQSGKITALTEGMATIIATCGTVSASCVVTVSGESIPCESLTLEPTEVTVLVGETTSIIATLVPANTTDQLSWLSDDAAVAKVDKYGRVTGVTVGKAVITALCGDQMARCTVTVEDESSINAVSVDAPEDDALYFTLQGNRVHHPAKGTVYIRIKNGQAEKILK